MNNQRIYFDLSKRDDTKVHTRYSFYNNNYDEDDYKLIKINNIVNDNISYKEYLYKCKEYYGTYRKVSALINEDNELIDAHCDCSFYMYYNTCNHITSLLVNYYETLFHSFPINVLKLSNKLLSKYVVNNPIIKKEVQLEIHIDMLDDYYKNADVKMRLGENKLYLLGNKFNSFKYSFEDKDGVVKFGKNFTYDPNIHYFSKENENVVEAFFKTFSDGMNTYRPKIKILLKSLKNSVFYFNEYKVDGIIEGFPLNTNLVKDQDNYKLNIDKDNLFVLANDNYEYIFYQNKMFHLNSKEQDLIKEILEKNIDNLIISDDNKETFTKGLLKIIKNNIVIDDAIDDLKLPSKINTSLYFDLRNNFIIANPKFMYDDIEVNYFDKKSIVIRDMDYEVGVINELLKYNFTIEDNKLLLKDLDSQVEFIENGLEELASNYPVYTTEKFKQVNIRKKSNVKSMFGIGQDNILNYEFSLDGIDNDELVNIFKNIRNRGRYYRLKSGDIISLEDDNLKKLESLSEELELTDEEIIEGKGKLQKFRAIYLDSLKNSKYDIISTDNLFDNFIKNFYEYKNSELTIDKKELEVLRDYQLVGVKWLYNLSKTGFGGILADEMGLGKTIQAIYYIKQILLEKKDIKFLIVVPTSLAYNWSKEFDVFGSKIKKIIIDGNKTTRESLLKNINDANVIITTYSLLREDNELYQDMSFHTMFIDEAQTIKNNSTLITKCVKNINAETKFALTGTPLENSVLELWSIFDFIMPGYLSNLTKFQSKYRIKDFNEESEKLIKNLSKQINPFILRRKKQDVVKELPEKLVNDIYVELNNEQKKLYAAETEKVKKEIDEAVKNGQGNKIGFLILPLLTRLRQFCISPSILYEDYKGESNKIEALINTVNEYTKNGHKILIFSSFLEGLELVEKVLKK